MSEKSILESYKVRQMMVGFTPEEVREVQCVQHSYILVLIAVGNIRKRQKEKEAARKEALIG